MIGTMRFLHPLLAILLCAGGLAGTSESASLLAKDPEFNAACRAVKGAAFDHAIARAASFFRRGGFDIGARPESVFLN